MIRIQRSELFHLWCDFKDISYSEKVNKLEQNILNRFGKDDLCIESTNVRSKVKTLVLYFSKKWTKFKSRRINILDNLDCAKYLGESEEFSINRKSPRKTPTTVEENSPVLNTGTRGRPRALFADLSRSQKHKRTAEVASKLEPDELSASTVRSLKESGKPTAAKVLKLTTETTPTKPAKILTAYEKSQKRKVARKLTADEACAMFIRNKFTVKTYKDLKKTTDDAGHYVFPSWEDVYASKKLCYPPDDKLSISEDSAEVELQSLVHHTYSRLCELLEGDITKYLSDEDIEYFSGDIKVGSDGTSGLSAFKMTSASGTLKEKAYVSCMCPLTLKAHCKTGKVITVWNNPRPCSTRFCRPLKFDFVPETDEVTIAEKERLFQCFNSVPVLNISLNEVNLVFKFAFTDFHYTMVDGKVANCLTDTASNQTCRICGATPKLMNNIVEVLKRPINSEALIYGVNPMHCRIRGLDNMLHLAYRDIDGVRVWAVRGDEQKQLVKERKRAIQKEFKQRLGLNIDMPKSEGSGNTNDGNTARRVFKNYKISSEITGINEELIERLGVILDVINCGYHIDPEKFRSYSMDTAKLYVQLYPWFYMPSSIHLLLIHGADIIKNFVNVPLGALSEEAQESKNKDFKRIRLYNTRKMSFITINTDLMHGMLAESDPKMAMMNLSKAHTADEVNIRQAVIDLLSSVVVDGADVDIESD